MQICIHCMKSIQGLKIIPGLADVSQKDPRIAEAKEFIWMACAMMCDVVEDMRREGLYSRKGAKAEKRKFRMARNALLRKKLATEDDIVEYYTHARLELKATVKICKQQFPRFAPSAGGA